MKNVLSYNQFTNESNQDSTFLFWQSHFIDEINIFLIFKENENYDILDKLFDQYGYGFYSPNDKMIIIDGELFVGDDALSKEDLRFIEAHEVAHLILNHNGPRNDEDEIEADLGAYILLKRAGFSTDRLMDEFEERHGKPFSTDLLKKVEDRI
jgi:Zn-dependent peptidase ImmA (M78 family)